MVMTSTTQTVITKKTMMLTQDIKSDQEFHFEMLTIAVTFVLKYLKGLISCLYILRNLLSLFHSSKYSDTPFHQQFICENVPSKILLKLFAYFKESHLEEFAVFIVVKTVLAKFFSSIHIFELRHFVLCYIKNKKKKNHYNN